MDPFERFPAEVICQIISYTADFAGVENLLLASQWMNKTFQAQPRIIFDVITSNPITAMPEIQQLLRSVAIIYNPSIHCADFEEYLQTIGNNDNSKAGPGLLPEQMAPAEILQIMHVAANIQRLACMCLYTMRQNFVSAVADTHGPAAAQKAAEPFVWIEEYRVYWALWHLQHYSALRKAAKGRWAWSKESIKKMADTYVSWNDIFRLLPEKIWTVAAILSDLGLRPLYGHSNQDKEELEDGCEEESLEIAAEFPLDTPIPFFASLDFLPHQNDYPIWSPPSVPDQNSKINQVWGRGLRNRLGETTPAAMIRSHADMTRNHPGFTKSSRDLKYMPPFRRLGVMLWDTWRMFSIGLLNNMFRKMRVPTPDGGIVGGEVFDVSLYDISSRWLALVGKPPPLVDS